VLAQRRAPYADLLAGIVGDSLTAFPPVPGRPIVEIGAGDGQLQAWLAPDLCARCVVTEPAHAAVQALRARRPTAPLARAEADRLPFAAGSAGSVIALCVFDALEDPTAAATEIARVLAPGGHFLHFLDMSTLRRHPFNHLAVEGLVPIPNVFGDASEHEWPLDMLLIPRDRLVERLALAERAGDPLPAAFAPAFAPFLSASFDVDAAIEAFRAVARNAALRQALAALLAAAEKVALAGGQAPLVLQPFHSGRYLQHVLEESFSRRGLFVVEQSAVVAKARARAARPDETMISYRSLCLGHERLLEALPARPLTQPAAPPLPGHVVVEAGVFVFVARRVG